LRGRRGGERRERSLVLPRRLPQLAVVRLGLLPQPVLIAAPPV